MHYADNLVKKEKRKIQELEKEMAKAQLPASEAIAKQVSEELDLPSKISRLSGNRTNGTPIFQRRQNLVVLNQSTQSNKFCIKNKGKLQNRQSLQVVHCRVTFDSYYTNLQQAIKKANTSSNKRISREPFSVRKSEGNRRDSNRGRGNMRGRLTSSSGKTDPFDSCLSF